MNRYFIENSNIVLRRILSKEENLDIVKDFIESILDIKIKEIIQRPYLGEKVKYLPSQEKYGIANFRIIYDEEKESNIGIQIVDGLYAQEKLLIYGASINENQTEYDNYSNIVDTITINILDFKGFLTSKYHKIIGFSRKNYTEGEKEIKNDLIFHVLQLPDFDIENPRNREEEWIQYLKGENIDSIEKIKESNLAIKKLDNILMNYWKEEKI